MKIKIFEEEVIKKLFFWVLKTKRVTRENKTDMKITHKKQRRIHDGNEFNQRLCR